MTAIVSGSPIIQNGKDIYRCVLEDGRLAMKFINMVKIYYELHEEAHAKT